MKRMMTMLLMVVVFFVSMPQVAQAEESLEKPFCQREMEREIDLIYGLYEEQLDQKNISGLLYAGVDEFLQNQLSDLTSENAYEKYSDFSDAYVEWIYEMHEEELRQLVDLAINIIREYGVEIPDYVKEYVKAFITVYNKDVNWLQKELEIYGYKEDWAI